jgi:hypothetical protein
MSKSLAASLTIFASIVFWSLAKPINNALSHKTFTTRGVPPEIR